ncbi:MAG: HDOD domain-containing protein [Desulfatitalea sp.]|nr:HDOD domain-containing protein [Desulfatitalea sp.]NNJ99155.1 HDOD domain-containing protein [Desulfatitalea sp.]
MTSENRLIGIQKYISRMPSLSTTVTKVLEICNQPTSSANDLNRVISLDPVLTGQVLKLINSAYYSLPHRVTSLTRAIIMLGVNTVKNLVLATSVLATFKGSRTAGAFSMDDYWAHCLCVGATAKALAALKHVPKAELEEFFVAGLLHDLGKLPMMACFPERYDAAVINAAEQGISLDAAERIHVGFDHCHVGYLICAKWKLKPDMRQSITQHHQPAAAIDLGMLVECVSLANQMALRYQIGGAGDTYSDDLLLQTLIKRLGIDVGAMDEMKFGIQEQIENARVFLKSNGKG